LSLSINGITCDSLFFTGILGTGMSALAQFCRWSGLSVAGSDRLLDAAYQAPVRTALESIGCRLFAQDGSGIAAGVQALVVSTAIEEQNPDIAAARAANIPVFHRSELLAAIVNTRRSIAVAGTSGKSTVTAMLFHLLDNCGMAPSLITGANLHSLIARGHIGNAWVGKSDWLIFEADESDGSIVHYHPAISLILNVSLDHKPIVEIIELFKTLSDHSSTTIANGDDAGLRSVPAMATFGHSMQSQWRCDEIALEGNAVAVALGGRRYRIPFPGLHNGRNLLAALSVGLYCGCSPDRLAAACPTFGGLQRRFDCTNTKRGVTVIDDYAHNPEKIAAAITTAQTLGRRLFAIFQPHGFGPTRFMFAELVALFSRVFRDSDTLILLPIYYVGGTARQDISSLMIADALTGKRAHVLAPRERDEVPGIIAAAAESGDTVLLMGARDPSLPLFARAIADRIDSM
jgi:UDP-N-acetylmuramate--alanine ligase